MMTLSKFAKLANVSVSTASKAFSGSREVNEETREMIFAIAREQKCFKKFFNAQYPKLVVAVLCPEFESLYYTRCLAFVQEKLDEYHCEVCMASHRFLPDRVKSLLEYYDRYAKVDGVIVMDAKGYEPEYVGLPVVFLNPEEEPKSFPGIIIEQEKALDEAVSYLQKHQVETVGFLGETLTPKSLEQLQLAMKKQNLILRAILKNKNNLKQLII